MKCPICGKYEFEEYDDFDICPVCNWENDGLQYDDHNYAGGANDLSVNEARIEYFVINHPVTAEKAAKAKEEYENNFIEINHKFAGINYAAEKERACQMGKELTNNQQKYIDRLSELMMSILIDKSNGDCNKNSSY